MKTGEKALGVLIVLLLCVGVGRVLLAPAEKDKESGSIPFYSSASAEVQNRAAVLYKDLKCRDCHRLWGVNNIMQFVPSPSLDGVGSLRDEAWLYEYFSSENPQEMLPTRLKKEFKMPSYATLSEKDRRLMAAYFSSLKVKDWYLDEVKRMEQEKLTGKKANES
ncbi:MAG: c-type cytochrome [Mariprofundaceae bacterium]|nr:c-type cytochrome [Mariprofundaceae bacterium]